MISDISAGNNYPLGVTLTPEGANFCVFSKNCTQLELLFFDHEDAKKPLRVITLDPKINRTFYYWHVFVKGVTAGQLYGYRAYGQFEPSIGLRFDHSKVLIDPYGRGVAVGKYYDRIPATFLGLDNTQYAMKSVVIDSSDYNWEGDKPLNLPYHQSVIYELHVGGFTKHPNSGLSDQMRGTYAGLIEKIPYLQALGITTVELMPVYQFDPHDAPLGQINYWGYSPVSFFAPHLDYSVSKNSIGAIREFRDMIKALHRAGIEVVLDVVFNHTAEGNHEGATFSYRGLENRAYYMLERDRTYYANYSGCGNTLNVSNSIVRRMIKDALVYWVSEMHVDGFRFDLASALTRDEAGKPLAQPPLIWEIDSEPILAGAKIIAEAWDAGGLYQVGSFVGDRWSEWNGKFRDDVRRFMKGDDGMVETFASRIIASPDLYNRTPDRDPNRSINFVTCHDGFTLNDLVSYNEKHNEDNGEDNRDGANDNYSWNCGIEGVTDDPHIESLRTQQIKNFLGILLLAQGTPMLLMGDEIRHTKLGNNNSYCHDDEMNWFDWSAVERESDLLRFTQSLVHFARSDWSFNMRNYWLGHEDVRLSWHGIEIGKPDWAKYSHTIAVLLEAPHGKGHVMINAFWEDLVFELPPNIIWHRLMDTSLPSPDDFCMPKDAPLVTESVYRVKARSMAIVVSAP